MATLEQISSFLEDWRQQKVLPSGQRLADFEVGFTRIKTELVPLKEMVEKRARETAPNFNLFEALRIEGYELVHSAFLAHLLDPSASHGQGLLFLQGFLNRCALESENIREVVNHMDKNGWEVVTELPIGNGRLDIAITNSRLSFLLVIENKVYAGEQGQQLARYSEWMAQKKEYRTQALVYLTIDGHQALTHGNYPYLRLSYRKDIRTWLENLLPEVQPERVRESIRQYCSSIDRL